MMIDAHQHYWKLSRGDYHWLTPAEGVLYRDYLPADLKPLLTEAGVARTVLVQAAPTVEESHYLLSLAEQEETIAGVVGWLDLASADFERQLAAMREHTKYVGIRLMLQSERPDYLEQSSVDRALRVLEEQQFPLDWLIAPQHLPAVRRVMEKHPGLRGVIDHIANPAISAGDMEPWRSDLAALADYEQLYCKLSGLATLTGAGRAESAGIGPYAQYAMSLFGPDRVMFGSDWPVCLKACGYGETIQLLESMMDPAYSVRDREKLFGGNAATFYQLKR